MKKQISQVHHIVYPSEKHPEQELTVKITKGEHRIASLLSWYTRKFVSKGFIKMLKIWIAMNEDRAEEL